MRLYHLKIKLLGRQRTICRDAVTSVANFVVSDIYFSLNNTKISLVLCHCKVSMHYTLHLFVHIVLICSAPYMSIVRLLNMHIFVKSRICRISILELWFRFWHSDSVCFQTQRYILDFQLRVQIAINYQHHKRYRRQFSFVVYSLLVFSEELCKLVKVEL